MKGIDKRGETLKKEQINHQKAPRPNKGQGIHPPLGQHKLQSKEKESTMKSPFHYHPNWYDYSWLIILNFEQT